MPDKTFKAVQYAKAGSWQVVNVPVPPVGVRDVRIKVHKSASAALASTCHVLGGVGTCMGVYPLIPGARNDLDIDEVCSEVSRLSPGQLVTVNPNIYCGDCDYCCAGRLGLCAYTQGMGVHRPGFFGEYVTTDHQQVFSVDGLDPDTCRFTTYRLPPTGLETLDMRPGDSALVTGAGPTGLLLAQLIASHCSAAQSAGMHQGHHRPPFRPRRVRDRYPDLGRRPHRAQGHPRHQQTHLELAQPDRQICCLWGGLDSQIGEQGAGSGSDGVVVAVDPGVAVGWSAVGFPDAGEHRRDDVVIRGLLSSVQSSEPGLTRRHRGTGPAPACLVQRSRVMITGNETTVAAAHTLARNRPWEVTKLLRHLSLVSRFALRNPNPLADLTTGSEA